MKNMIITQYQMKRAERKKVAYSDFGNSYGIFCSDRNFLCDTLRDFRKGVNLDGFCDGQSYDSV